MVAAVYATPYDARARLAELGLSEDLLLIPAKAGQLAWENCTSNHPLSAPGFYAWAETVRCLREVLIPLGWESFDDVCLPLVLSPGKQLAITVSSGTDATGRAEHQVQTKSGKGPRTIDVVTQNQLQANLFPKDAYLSDDAKAKLAERLAAQDGRTTWLLLFCRDQARRELRCELSRPIAMDAETNRISGWAERIILPASPMDDGPTAMPINNGPGGPMFDIEVKKRA